MKKFLKKALAFLVSAILIATVVLPCLTMLSFAETPEKVTYKSWNTAGFATFRDAFSLYSGTNAATYGLEKLDWEQSVNDKFVYASGALRHEATDEMVYTDPATEANKYLSIIANDGVKYRDFEISIKYTMRDASDYLYPGVIFGSHDLSSWGKSVSGWYAGFAYNGAGSVKPAIEGYDAATGSYKVDAPATFDDGAWDSTKQYVMTVKVQGTNATISVEQSSTSTSFSQSFTVPAEYTGGYVGLLLRGANYYIWQIDFTDLGGEVEDPNAVTFDFSNSADYNAAESGFDVYYSNQAANGVLEEADFGDHFESTSNALVHKPTETLDPATFENQVKNNVTTLIYNDQKYRNFQVTVVAKGTAAANKMSLLFGVQENDAWKAEGAGYEASLNYVAGQSVPYINSFVTYGEYTEYAPTPATNTAFLGWDKVTTLTLKVQDTTATFTVQSEGAEVVTTTFNIGASYGGGSLGLAFIPDATEIYSIKLSNLGGEVLEAVYPETVYDFSQSDAITQLGANAEVYYSNAAVMGTLDKVALGDHFKVENSALVHKPTQTLTSSNKSDLTTNNVTNIIFKNNEYRNFQMTVVAQGTDVTYGVGMLFGVREPQRWLVDGMGFLANVNYNNGGMSSSFLQSYAKYASDITKYTAYSPSTLPGFTGWKGKTTYTLTVVDSTATFTVTTALGVTNEQTVTLASDYMGGMLGLTFIPDATKVYSIKIQDLGGNVETPIQPDDYFPILSKTIYNFSKADDFAAFKENFTFYHGSQKDGLVQCEFEDYLNYASGRIVNIPEGGEEPLYMDPVYSTKGYNSHLTTMVSNKEYVNFKLRVRWQNKQGVGVFPSIVFGIQDPTGFLTPESGIITGLFSNAYTGIKLGYKNYDFITDKTSTTLEPGSHDKYYCLFATWLEITVLNGKIKYSIVNGDNWLAWEYETDLPFGYNGGKIAYMTRGYEEYFYNLEITDLGGEVVQANPKRVTVKEVLSTPAIEVPTTTLISDVPMPEKVKVLCDDDQVYEIPVTWKIENYDRFKRGEYKNLGELENTLLYDKMVVVDVNYLGAESTIRVVGDKDADPITIACVGDSITYGGGSSILTNYPNVLQEILGGEYDVRNCGINAACLLTVADTPYTETAGYVESVSCNPDIVLIMLGTNDSKTNNWPLNFLYESDYKELIDAYKNLASKPTVYVLTSPYAALNMYNIQKDVVANEVVPLQKKIASDNNLPLIDIFDLTNGHNEWYTDGIHPTAEGHAEIAYYIATQVALPRPVKEIILDKEDFNLLTGDTVEIGYSFSPLVIEGDTTVAWTSSDNAVATVSGGKITGVAPGTATITATCQGKTDTITVTVIDKYESINLALRAEAQLEDFDAYFATDATKGMNKVDNYKDYWNIDKAKGVMRKDSSLGNKLLGDANVASLVYNVREFHNFKLNVEMRRTEHGQGEYPMVVFGIKDPTKYYKQQGGGIAVYATANGDLVVEGYINGKFVREVSPAPANNTKYKKEGPHEFVITVEYQKVTVTMVGATANEPIADPITVVLGDEDMDGYIALYGKDNLCGFKNLSIVPLKDKDPEEVAIKEILGAEPISKEVGTTFAELGLPATVEVVGENDQHYTLDITWDINDYNRYVRATYAIKGTMINTLFDKVKVMGAKENPVIEVTLTGDKDLVVDGEFRCDFLSEKDLEKFSCYFTDSFDKDLTGCYASEHWYIEDGTVKRKQNIPTNGDNNYNEQINYSSSLLYTGRTYTNFELEVDYMRHSEGNWWAMLVFGVQDPTKHMRADVNGGIAVFADASGKPCILTENGPAVYNKVPTLEHAPHSEWHHLKVVVNDGMLYIYIDKETPLTWMIPEAKRVDGYVGMMCNQNWASFKNFAVRPLADSSSANAEGFNASKYPELTYAGDAETVDANLMYKDAYKKADANNTAVATAQTAESGFMVVAIMVSLFAIGYVFGGKVLKKRFGK